MFFLTFKTSVLSNNRFAKLFKVTSFSRATMVIRFPAKTIVGCPKALRDFPPRKDGILQPPSGCLGTLLPLPQSLYGRTYADITTKISWIDRLPNLLSNGAPLAGFARGLSYKCSQMLSKTCMVAWLRKIVKMFFIENIMIKLFESL